jgi:glycopeptide antibiotics resistance protein
MGFSFNEFFVICLPIWVIFRFYILLKSFNKKEKFSFFKEFTINIFGFYILFLIYATLLPRFTTGSNVSNLNIYQRFNINLIPFNDFIKGNYTNVNLIRHNLIGNILLLAPFIFYLCLTKESIRSLKTIVKISFLISLSIEIFQLIINLLGISGYLRAVDVDDLILNTLGGIITYFIFKIIYHGIIKNLIDKIYKEQKNSLNGNISNTGVSPTFSTKPTLRN